MWRHRLDDEVAYPRLIVDNEHPSAQHAATEPAGTDRGIIR
ncbi:hypothetical protein MBELCI_2045 [Limimaricola cinnabarinus LL-001]|uniref:Uncharacterized protein n=1 Tax=Limimaricola cinnabarinus LL-001 TaxID=1337093 RepID=U3AMM8_9RHOB|nr:hypothetical protein MBELCI_2045 [Limimaricola cinnabarinus LL-001]